MALGVLMTSGFLGFFAAIVSGLALGLGWIECLAVYSAVGLAVTALIFFARGLVLAVAYKMA